MKMWVQEVKRLFFKLSEVEVAPDSAHDWAEAVLEMAGWIVDMAIGLEHAGDSGGGDWWMIEQLINRYQKAMEKLRAVEMEQI